MCELLAFVRCLLMKAGAQQQKESGNKKERIEMKRGGITGAMATRNR